MKSELGMVLEAHGKAIAAIAKRGGNRQVVGGYGRPRAQKQYPSFYPKTATKAPVKSQFEQDTEKAIALSKGEAKPKSKTRTPEQIEAAELRAATAESKRTHDAERRRLRQQLAESKADQKLADELRREQLDEKRRAQLAQLEAAKRDKLRNHGDRMRETRSRTNPDPPSSLMIPQGGVRFELQDDFE